MATNNIAKLSFTGEEIDRKLTCVDEQSILQEIKNGQLSEGLTITPYSNKLPNMSSYAIQGIRKDSGLFDTIKVDNILLKDGGNEIEANAPGQVQYNAGTSSTNDKIAQKFKILKINNLFNFIEYGIKWNAVFDNLNIYEGSGSRNLKEAIKDKTAWFQDEGGNKYLGKFNDEETVLWFKCYNEGVSVTGIPFNKLTAYYNNDTVSPSFIITPTLIWECVFDEVSIQISPTPISAITQYLLTKTELDIIRNNINNVYDYMSGNIHSILDSIQRKIKVGEYYKSNNKYFLPNTPLFEINPLPALPASIDMSSGPYYIAFQNFSDNSGLALSINGNVNGGFEVIKSGGYPGLGVSLYVSKQPIVFNTQTYNFISIDYNKIDQPNKRPDQITIPDIMAPIPGADYPLLDAHYVQINSPERLDEKIQILDNNMTDIDNKVYSKQWISSESDVTEEKIDYIMPDGWVYNLTKQLKNYWNGETENGNSWSYSTTLEDTTPPNELKIIAKGLRNATGKYRYMGMSAGQYQTIEQLEAGDVIKMSDFYGPSYTGMTLDIILTFESAPPETINIVGLPGSSELVAEKTKLRYCPSNYASSGRVWTANKAGYNNDSQTLSDQSIEFMGDELFTPVKNDFIIFDDGSFGQLTSDLTQDASEYYYQCKIIHSQPTTEELVQNVIAALPNASGEVFPNE